MDAARKMRYQPPRAGRPPAGGRLACWTTFRVGGACREAVCCGGPDAVERAIARVRRRGMDYIVLGGGSNVLVSDDGIDAAVIRFADGGRGIDCRGGRVTAAAGVGLDRLVRYTVSAGLGDLSFASGIPGTTGGGLAGNAGAFGRAMGDQVSRVQVLRPDGIVEWRAAAAMGFGYRASRLVRGEVILRAEWTLEPADVGALRRRRAEALAWRRERHPRWSHEPCAGSVFRNPGAGSGGAAAGALLQQSGAHNMSRGGARVYPGHANIIIADGPRAKAGDVAELMAAMQQRVWQHCGVLLEPEIVLLGAFARRPRQMGTQVSRE